MDAVLRATLGEMKGLEDKASDLTAQRDAMNKEVIFLSLSLSLSLTHTHTHTHTLTD